MNEDTELVIIRHPRTRKQFKIKLEDLDDTSIHQEDGLS
jgi:hypothetical protein